MTVNPLESNQNSRIQTLSVHLANQISAGEVIERPASVVKELVENSLDAGASQIDIAIEQAGTLSIKIMDNGVGIHKDDLTIALAPHATSKIRQSADLEEILTLGFRGEALASISSVARVKLQSRQADSHSGWATDSTTADPYPTAVPPGTQIEVRELFYNTPARKRFLRAERTEYLQVEEVVRRLALSHFNCGFSFKNNHKLIFKVALADSKEKQTARAKQFFGKRFIENSLEIDRSLEGLRLNGWIGNAGFSLSQNDRQYVYLNGRMVKDRLITHALRQAYNEVIEPGRSPAFLLYLSIDPALVDVNVHPTKHEVRFREARRIHDFLFASLSSALKMEHESDEMISMPLETSESIPYPRPQTSEQVIPHYLAEGRASYHRNDRSTSPQILDEKQGVINTIGQHFMLAPLQGQTVVIDLKAIHQDYVLARLSQDDSLVLQPLLFPVVTRLETADPENLTINMQTVATWGIALELNQDQISLKQMPALLRGVDPQQFILALQGNPDELLQRLTSLSVIESPPYNLQTLLQFLVQHELDNLPSALDAGYAKVLSEDVLTRIFTDGS
jgi:DNA mismatch repair protein MutL